MSDKSLGVRAGSRVCDPEPQSVSAAHAAPIPGAEDTARLDFIERMTDEGWAPCIVYDDDGRWAVTYDGSSPIPPDGGFRKPVHIVTMVMPNLWRDSIRAAIDAAMDDARGMEAEGGDANAAPGEARQPGPDRDAP